MWLYFFDNFFHSAYISLKWNIILKFSPLRFNCFPVWSATTVFILLIVSKITGRYTKFLRFSTILYPSNFCKATAVAHTKRIDRNLLRKETSFVCYPSSKSFSITARTNKSWHARLFPLHITVLRSANHVIVWDKNHAKREEYFLSIRSAEWPLRSVFTEQYCNCV